MTGKHKPIQVLLLEDNPGDALLFRTMLSTEDTIPFEIEHVTKLSAALKRLADQDVDIALLDLSLPDSQGLQTFYTAHDEAPQVPIVVLSGSGSEAIAIEAVQAGAQDYLVKGEINDRTLVRSIRYAIERARTERRLRHQKELLESALESLTYPFYIVDAEDYTLEIANSAATAALGKQARHPTCYELSHDRDTPCDGQTCPCPLEDVKATKAPVTVEHVHYDENGEPRIVEVHGYPIFDDSGNVVQMIEYALDITERRQAKEALRQERDLIARLMDTSPISITMVNRRGEIVFANERAEEVLGLTRARITGRTYNAPDWHITDLNGEPLPDEALPFQQVMATQTPVYDVRHAIEWADGQRRLLSINGAPILDESGEVDRVVFAIEDITQQVREEEERVAQLERELDSLETLAALPNTRVAARSYGLAPLRESQPNVFDDLVERYEAMMEKALEQRAYKIEDESSQEITAMAERLGALRAGPRDVVDIHILALKNKSRNTNAIKAGAYAEESRLIALELMGDLASYYRKRCVYIVRSSPAEGAGPRKKGESDG